MFLASSFEIEVMCVPWRYIRYTHMQSRTCIKPSELRTEENTETAMDLRKEKSIQCLQSEIPTSCWWTDPTFHHHPCSFAQYRLQHTSANSLCAVDTIITIATFLP